MVAAAFRSGAFAQAHDLGMATVLWCYLRNNAFKKNKDYHLSSAASGGYPILLNSTKHSRRFSAAFFAVFPECRRPTFLSGVSCESRKAGAVPASSADVRVALVVWDSARPAASGRTRRPGRHSREKQASIKSVSAYETGDADSVALARSEFCRRPGRRPRPHGRNAGAPGVRKS
jgi:hypothetical protein